MSEYTEAHKTFNGVRYVTVKLANQMVSEQNEEIEKLQAENEALKAKLNAAEKFIKDAFSAHPNLDLDIENLVN